MSDDEKRQGGPGLRTGALSGADETEGHAYKSGRLVDDAQDGPRARGMRSDEDTTEGHMPVIRNNVVADDEDTGGHAARIKALVDDGDSDTEGHMPLRKILTDDGDETEGHGVRIRF